MEEEKGKEGENLRLWGPYCLNKKYKSQSETLVKVGTNSEIYPINFLNLMIGLKIWKKKKKKKNEWIGREE